MLKAIRENDTRIDSWNGNVASAGRASKLRSERSPSVTIFFYYTGYFRCTLFVFILNSIDTIHITLTRVIHIECDLFF